MGKLIGIDLGTTKACVAVIEGGRPRVIPNQEGERTTPSVVAFTGSGPPLVGEAALRRALMEPERTVLAAHRLIGRRFDSIEVQRAHRSLPYGLVAGPHGEVHVRIEDQVYSTAKISSFVLQMLKAAAENDLGEPVKEAIITVPFSFNHVQRQAIKEAGLMAGLTVGREFTRSRSPSIST